MCLCVSVLLVVLREGLQYTLSSLLCAFESVNKEGVFEDKDSR